MYLQRYIDMHTRTRAHTHTQTHAHATCVFIYFWRVRYTNLCVCGYLHFFFIIIYFICSTFRFTYVIRHMKHTSSLSLQLFRFPSPLQPTPPFFPPSFPSYSHSYTRSHTLMSKEGDSVWPEIMSSFLMDRLKRF